MIKKNEKGITLITLVVTIIILAIITATLAGNAYDTTHASRLAKLDNDIKALNDRIAAYYVEHDELPICGTPYKKDNLKNIITDLSGNDGDEYYTIDLSKLDNITLNYGVDYQSMAENSYIINMESHVIYYLQGINYRGKIYHTVGQDTIVSLDF